MTAAQRIKETPMAPYVGLMRGMGRQDIEIVVTFLNEIMEEQEIPENVAKSENIAEMARKKFNIPESLIDMAIGRILKNGVRGERIMSGEIFPDLQDAVFYEVALSKDDAYLVTGNTKHFPQTPIVVTPTDMVEILRRNQLL